MSYLKKIKDEYRRFAQDYPGARFVNLYRRMHQGRSSIAVTIMGVAAGLILIVLGVLLGLVPGVPGVVLMALGVALIASQFPSLAGLCDRIELAGRQMAGSVKKWFRSRKAARLERKQTH